MGQFQRRFPWRAEPPWGGPWVKAWLGGAWSEPYGSPISLSSLPFGAKPGAGWWRGGQSLMVLLPAFPLSPFGAKPGAGWLGGAWSEPYGSPPCLSSLPLWR